MADLSTYSLPTTPECPQPATHLVAKGPHERAWRIEEVSLVCPETVEMVESSIIVARGGFEVAEFCLRHAGDVMEQRNAPPPMATLLPRPKYKAPSPFDCVVCHEPLGVASYTAPKVGKICSECQQAYGQVNELAPVPAPRGRKPRKAAKA